MKKMQAARKMLNDQDILLSPTVGKWIPTGKKVLVTEEAVLGWIQVLGVRHEIGSSSANGWILETSEERWIGYGDSLGLLHTGEGKALVSNDDTQKNANSNRVFRSPTSGRFYSRPTPDKPRFVEEGDRVTPGQVICLLEVMKTFNRIEFDEANPSKIIKILLEDGDDVENNDPLFVLE